MEARPKETCLLYTSVQDPLRQRRVEAGRPALAVERRRAITDRIVRNGEVRDAFPGWPGANLPAAQKDRRSLIDPRPFALPQIAVNTPAFPALNLKQITNLIDIPISGRRSDSVILIPE